MSITEQHNKLMELLLGAVGADGNKLSEQRLRVVHALCAMEYFENAEELWILLNAKKKISRAMVYNCLGILVKAGYIIKTTHTNGGASYRLRHDI
ncbi:transcriptional repressor [Sphingobacterium sp. UT-1RO-CII-1]|uniref:transcriptional repressor n=1 Tax=Sphingobacterium sp. UT-1RO-CII-1 TaxID=2995225 RepID=UPI00227B2536|nr:transcriptional repressor [Sphingobacterium sp. UT-1RO-CII-1]MCY4779993.1 transcriptional repressor [Sphingobacterium sp. UT-1RO-CII-1]